MKRQRTITLVITLAILAGVNVLAEVFPGLKAYVPTFEDILRTSAERTEYDDVAQPSPTDRSSAKTRDMVLAVSWQPAFCERASNKRECRSQTADRFDATHFSLHGLWTDRQNCGGRWERVSEGIWRDLKRVMPGTASGLHKHEWEKHGTCYADNPDIYYADSLKLMGELNNTPVRDLFVRSKGRFLGAREIRAAFDDTFGRGTGDRVRIKCVRDGDRELIEELRISLKGDASHSPFGMLLKQARGQKQGCSGGIVDTAGLQ
ncbi:MAG: ribonuclease [Pseudomonadota bacterium]